MERRYVDAVCRAAENIFTGHFGLPDVQVLEIHDGETQVPAMPISVILGVHGALKGQIICSFQDDTAKQIIGTMMGGMEVAEIDDLGWSAIQEFGNWVAGTSATEISKEGVVVDVTPPVINEGHSRFRSTNVFTTVPLETAMGRVEIHVALQEEQL
ncbi:chemotaxis protein CheX [Ectobacillus ponti]|uniref:Chemotaxis protein CheC n=1 Tax=Ectobacillus ponti TaxID=2961894 RepID=A0AA41X815_9BACI|nr:chemotaxis protein CheC [Ectobacillus ponti]MCP8968389.1 chemotaxis protein CheC [Ectobacillus ponti]